MHDRGSGLGDGKCDGTEDCSNCPGDCGKCIGRGRSSGFLQRSEKTGLP